TFPNSVLHVIILLFLFSLLKISLEYVMEFYIFSTLHSVLWGQHPPKEYQDKEDQTFYSQHNKLKQHKPEMVTSMDLYKFAVEANGLAVLIQ
ncbi:hypothetical protein STEG23_037039, partial [Scotinomys teguina]